MFVACSLQNNLHKLRLAPLLSSPLLFSPIRQIRQATLLEIVFIPLSFHNLQFTLCIHFCLLVVQQLKCNL